MKALLRLLGCLVLMVAVSSCENASEPAEPKTGYWIEDIRLGDRNYMFILHRPSDDTGTHVDWPSDTIRRDFSGIGYKQILARVYRQHADGGWYLHAYPVSRVLIGSRASKPAMESYSKATVEFLGLHDSYNKIEGQAETVGKEFSFQTSADLSFKKFDTDSGLTYFSRVPNIWRGDQIVELGCDNDISILKRVSVELGGTNWLHCGKAKLLVSDDSTAVYLYDEFTPEFNFYWSTSTPGKHSGHYVKTYFDSLPNPLVQIKFSK